MSPQALDDLRVLDLSRGIAGSYAGKMLADHGADVIKVESLDGDPLRRLGPFPDDQPHPEHAGLFLFLNTNKRSLTLDISTTSGQVILRKLLSGVHVLIEDFAPGELHKWGLGWEDLKDKMPGLVYASVTPFGQTGPYRDYKGNALTAMAMSGLMYVTGNPDREPLATGGEPAEYQAGIHLWIGVLAAVEERERSGRGQQVDVSLMEAACASDEYNSGLYSHTGGIRRRFYSRHTFSYPSDILPCKDGYVVVVPGAGGFPQLMALLIDQPELAEHPLFTDIRERFLRWQEFDGLIRPYFMEHTAEEIVTKAQEIRMPFALVPTPADLLDSVHLRERGFFAAIDNPKAGVYRYPGAPFRSSEMQAQPGPAPLLGEHNAEVLEGLGYERSDLAILSDRGVV
jgi:CoA:oxalate CoA-transferase